MGEQDQVDTVTGAEFVQQMRDVGLDGRFGDEQRGGDLGVGAALCHLVQDLAFAGVRRRRAAAVRGSGLPPRWLATRRRVTSASSSTSPWATARTAASIEARGLSLSRKPLAPTRRACST